MADAGKTFSSEEEEANYWKDLAMTYKQRSVPRSSPYVFFPQWWQRTFTVGLLCAKPCEELNIHHLD